MNWQPPSDWLRIFTLDAHAEGEPLRIVTSGIAPLPGKTILEKRRYAREHLDGLRRTLMFEPRGHADMYGALVTEPVTTDGDLGVLFMHNEGWSTMCGHGVIALVTVALETGMSLVGINRHRRGLPLTPREIVRLDTPAGRVTAFARLQGQRVTSVAFENVPSFAYALDEFVDVPNLGRVRYDLGFGGGFYAYVKANDIGVELVPRDYRKLIEHGSAIKHAVMNARAIHHPFESDLSFLYGTIFVGPPEAPDAHAREMCIFAEGEVDRSPTGTGVSGLVALEFARGRLKENVPFIVESILGTRFTGRVLRPTKFAQYDAVIPQVEGRAWITGRNEFLIAPDDPLREGFILR